MDDMKVTVVVQTPTEGKWFEVDPKTIKRSLFIKKRKDPKQELTRQLILEAFIELKNNPIRYPGVFNTMIPQKTWSKKSVSELKKYPSEWDGHIADWVEQALEWAQRIQNGEPWNAICNDADTANWYRLIVWKNDELRLVGGASLIKDATPAASVYHYKYHPLTRLHSAVPLVVLYDE